VTQLDLSHRPLADEELPWIFASLPKLRILVLSGCKKLQNPLPGIFDSLRTCKRAPPLDQIPHMNAAQSTTIPMQLIPPRSPFQALDLQRCFQLTEAALTDALRAAMQLPCLSCLSCLALSHLSLEKWPLGVLPYRPRAALAQAPPPLPTAEQQEPTTIAATSPAPAPAAAAAAAAEDSAANGAYAEGAAARNGACAAPPSFAEAVAAALHLPPQHGLTSLSGCNIQVKGMWRVDYCLIFDSVHYKLKYSSQGLAIRALFHET